MKLQFRGSPNRANKFATLSQFSGVGVAFCTAVLTSSANAQILQVEGSSLTSYIVASDTPVQGVRPRFDQRGVFIDGRARSGSPFGWALNGNPLDPPIGTTRLGEITLATGSFDPSDVDLALPAVGIPWVVGRSYNGRQIASTTPQDSNGYQGINWFQSSQPELRFYDADSNSGTRQAADMVYIVYGAERYIELKRTAANVDTFRGVNGASGVVLYSGTDDTFTYTDQNGTQIVLNGGDNTLSGYGKWQLWKMTDAAGNVTFVGSTTKSTAISSGYDSAGRMLYAYDASDRRYSYTYTTIDSVVRLTRVKAETKTSGSWASPSGVAEVGRVDYDYYQTGDDAHGDDGNLKLVTLTTPLSDPTQSLIQRKYYRYYQGSYNASTNPGHPNHIKMVVGFEGVRSYDWLDSNLSNASFNGSGVSDATMRDYSDVYLEYDSSDRVKTAVSNGECGCSGGANGTYGITYDNASSYSTYVGNASYDNSWAVRAVIDQPDAGWMTRYYDEVGQPMSEVLTDGNPAVSYTNRIATKWARSSIGIVDNTYLTNSISAYSHNTGGSPSQGEFTIGIGVGRVNEETITPSGDLIGFASDTSIDAGGSSALVTDRSLSQRAMTVSSIDIGRPQIDSTNRYPDGVTGEQTSYTYVFYSSTATDQLYLAPKSITTTNPAVTTGNNGSNSATTTVRYFNQDGREAFAKDESGVFTYNEYDSYGLRSKNIRDPKSSSGETAMDTAADSSHFNLTLPAGGLHYLTSYSYDPQGRTSTVMAPDGRVSVKWYTVLSDGRMVTLDIPRWTTGGGTTYFGPVTYRVSNHAGKQEFDGLIGVADAGTTTALTSWIDSTDSDPITALDGTVGSLRRMKTILYTVTAHQATESRAYFLIPASGSGSAGTNFDSTTYSYDDMGRNWRVVDPTGTITRSVFDFAGRKIESWIGLNDHSFVGGSGGGSDDMTKTEAFEYDALSHETKSTLDPDGDWVTTTDQRVTEQYYDDRGRMIYSKYPQAPHLLFKYDNLDRIVAVGMYAGITGLTTSTDPTSAATASFGVPRLALTERFYDQRGRVFQTTEWEINQSTGAKGASLDSLSWYDASGRLIKYRGKTYTKTYFDSLGRKTHKFELANSDDSTYSDAGSVAGDVILEESQTIYDNVDKSGTVVMAVKISRHHNDIGGSKTTGALDSNADNDSLTVTAGNLSGRAQITANWYDSLNRPVDTVSYGSYNGTTFERRPSGVWLSAPSRSDTALRSTTTYNDDGTVKEVTDPRGIVAHTDYDDAGRTIKQIANYDDGAPGGGTLDDKDHTIRYEYTNGLRTKYIADLTGSGNDQETVYTYGTVKGTVGSGSPIESSIASGRLLHHIAYPDSGGASDVVTSAYNALGEQIWTKDQSGNVIETDLDTGGRITHKKVTTLISGFDGAVRRISMAYLNNGRVDTVTQYDNATPGSGSVIDQVQYTYDGWGNTTKFEQDVDGVIGAGGRAAFNVQNAFTAVTGGNGRYTMKRTSQTLPGSFTVTYDYSSSSSSLAADISRVSGLTYNSGSKVTYAYVGVSQLVRTSLLEPGDDYNLTDNPSWTSVPGYGNLDRFDRVSSSRWTNSSTVDYYRVDLAYDRNSNITTADDTVLTAGIDAAAQWDVKYSMDDLNRVVEADEGELSGGSITNRGRDERWKASGGGAGLSPTGAWVNHRLDLDGDGSFSGTNELDESNTFNKANEQTARQPTTSVSPTYSPAYDDMGNQTDDGRDYTYKYDAFGRLKEVHNRLTPFALVAEYKYNGLDYRIGWHYDVTRSGGGAPDGTVDSNDPWYYFAYDEQWRPVATFRGSDSNPKERTIYHNAGLDGKGSSSYVDSVVLTDRDLTNGWSGSADGTLEVRNYINQNWRGDVAVVTDSSGVIQERIKYSAYGVPFCIASADFNCDGTVDFIDYLDFVDNYSATDPRADVNFDGAVNSTDNTVYTAWNTAQSGEVNGRGVLSRAAIGNRFGYAAYQWDPAIAGAAVLGAKWHVRNRVLDSERGTWLRRDPLGYVDGEDLYTYCAGLSIIKQDPDGTVPSCVGSRCYGDPSVIGTARGFCRLLKSTGDCRYPAGTTQAEALESTCTLAVGYEIPCQRPCHCGVDRVIVKFIKFSRPVFRNIVTGLYSSSPCRQDFRCYNVECMVGWPTGRCFFISMPGGGGGMPGGGGGATRD